LPKPARKSITKWNLKSWKIMDNINILFVNTFSLYNSHNFTKNKNCTNPGQISATCFCTLWLICSFYCCGYCLTSS
jgi:hypothetical protein